MSEISVIIPVYNVENYLDDCLSSLLDQSFHDFEIILIDDGSTDRSGEIADEYAKKDRRIRVTHKKNEGVARARNDGLRQINSPYVMWVDSDDYVLPGFFEVPYSLIKSNEADMVCFEYRRDPDGVITTCPHINQLISKNEALVLLSGWKISDSLCVKLFRSDVFKDISFADNTYYEDIGMVYRLIEKSSRIYVTDRVLYVYRNTPGSISHNILEKVNSDLRMMQDRKFRELLNIFNNEESVFSAFEVFNYAFEYLITRNHGHDLVTEQHAIQIVHRLNHYSANLSRDKRRLYWLYCHVHFLFDILCKQKGYRK